MAQSFRKDAIASFLNGCVYAQMCVCVCVRVCACACGGCLCTCSLKGTLECVPCLLSTLFIEAGTLLSTELTGQLAWALQGFLHLECWEYRQPPYPPTQYCTGVGSQTLIFRAAIRDVSPAPFCTPLGCHVLVFSLLQPCGASGLNSGHQAW